MAERDEPDPADDRAPDLPELPELPDLPNPPQLKLRLPDRPADRDDKREYRQMGLAYTLPAALIAPIVLFTVAGYFLDQHLHTGSRYTLGGALLGTVVGFINMFRMASRLD